MSRDMPEQGDLVVVTIREGEFNYMLGTILKDLPDSVRGALRGSIYSITSKKGIKDAGNNFLKIKCKSCGNEQIVYSKISSVVVCNICGSTIAKPTGEAFIPLRQRRGLRMPRII